MIDETLINKIKSLLAKTVENGCSVEEAASAFAIAQKFLMQHRLTMADIDLLDDKTNDEPVDDFGTMPGTEGLRVATWKESLANTLAKFNSCKSYTHKGYEKSGVKSSIKIVGRNSDVQIVNYLFMYICNEIERLCKENMKSSNGHGKTWSNSFKIGAVVAINKKFEEVKKETHKDASQKALVFINKRDEDVKLWVKDNLKLKSLPSSYRKDADAFASGYSAGSNIQINAGLNGGGKPIKQLR